MYSVSDRYISSMADALREMPGFALTLYNLDVDAHAALSIDYPTASPPLQTGKNLTAVASIGAPKAARATFEPGCLTASGLYSLSETDSYIGAAQSLSTMSSGVYPYITQDVVMLQCTKSSTKPITIRLDAAVAQVQLTHSADSTVQTLSFADDGQTHIITYAAAAETVTLRFLASHRPRRRPRLYGVLVGTMESLNTSRIVNIRFTDTNDLMGLELPGRSVTVDVDNLSGWLNPVAELAKPTYHKNSTQAMLSYLYAGETVPIGRLFLSGYKVSAEYVSLSFGWGTQPLSSFVHKISVYGSDYTALERIQEVFDPDPSMYLPGLRSIEHPCRVYAVSADLTALAGKSDKIALPLPAQPESTCLQMICNATGWIMRPCRGIHDIVFADGLSFAPLRQIGFGELLDDPTYEDTGTQLGGSTVFSYSIVDATQQKVADKVTVGNDMVCVQLDAPSDSQQWVLQTIKNSSGVSVGTVNAAHQGYTMYLWVEMLDGSDRTVVMFDVTATVHPLQKQSTNYGSELPERELDNPLLDSTLARNYWYNNMAARLACHSLVTVRHRGYPELDCGDCIQVQLTPGGDYQTGWIVRNDWTFSAGVLSGETQIMLMGGSG